MQRLVDVRPLEPAVARFLIQLLHGAPVPGVGFAMGIERLALALETAEAFGKVLAADGWGEITTEIAAADDKPFYYAEEYHQQYLHKVPNGYDCHSATGLQLPDLDEGTTLRAVD